MRLNRVSGGLAGALAALVLSLSGTARGADAAVAAGMATGVGEQPAIDSIERERAIVSARELSAAFRHAAEVIEPSVVHIITEQAGRRGFRQQTGVGSGIVMDARGYILTNNHVTEAGQTITVRLADGRELPATLVGAFAETDLAVLKVKADGLTPAAFGDSEALGVGEWVLAVGSPFGFEQTVTAGIVSAKGRGSIDPSSMEDAPGRFQEFIQTDAAINPGNSGGPLVDLDGRIVGINTAIASRDGGSNGLGFAIPADIARAVMDRIIETGRVERGWLGIDMGRLDPSDAYDLGIEGGVLVNGVLPGSPASEAGLKAGDIIVSINGRTTENITRLSNAIMLSPPGKPAPIVFYRGQERKSASAVMADRTTAQAAAQGGERIDKAGLVVVPETIQMVRRGMVVGEVAGFRVTEVFPGSPAADSGFQAQDFIFDVDGRTFDTAKELAGFLRTAALKEAVRMGVIRNNQRGSIELRAN